ncbi:hypothetical protein ACFIOY_17820 [Bradyrhizobium sp. TZ2]
MLEVVVLAGGRGRNTRDEIIAGEARDGDAGITAVEKVEPPTAAPALCEAEFGCFPFTIGAGFGGAR